MKRSRITFKNELFQFFPSNHRFTNLMMQFSKGMCKGFKSKAKGNMVLHEHCSGCIEIANPKGEIFHPKGRSKFNFSVK